MALQTNQHETSLIVLTERSGELERERGERVPH